MALIFAAIVGLGILFVNIRAHRRLAANLSFTEGHLRRGGAGRRGRHRFGRRCQLQVHGGRGRGKRRRESARRRPTLREWLQLSLYGGLVAMVVGMAFAAYEAYLNREELRGIDVKAMGRRATARQTLVFPRAFELVALLGLVCVVLQAGSRRVDALGQVLPRLPPPRYRRRIYILRS